MSKPSVSATTKRLIRDELQSAIDSRYNQQSRFRSQLMTMEPGMTDAKPSVHWAHPITPENICFSRIHLHCKRDHDIWHGLGRGKAILNSSEQLEQYFHSYGPMISTQWREIKRSLDLHAEKLDIIDYGCGQGIGTIQVFDHLRLGGIPNGKTRIGDIADRSDRLRTVLNVNLIEPSGIALSKARKILGCYPSKSVLNCINKKLDQVDLSDLNITQSSTKLHIFSNILDIGTFDQKTLLKKVLSIKGNHCIIAVSPKRSDGGIRMQEAFDSIIEYCNVRAYKKWNIHYKTQNHDAFVIHLEA